MFAKSASRNGGLGPMPLRTHAHDTAWFAGEVCKWLPQAVMRMMANVLGCTVDEVRRTAQFLAAVHDLAKDTPMYVEWFRTNIRPLNRKPHHAHDMVGEYLLSKWLIKRGGHTGWATVIGAHHGWSTSGLMRRNPYLGIEKAVFGGEQYHQRREALLSEMYDRYQPRLDLVPTVHVLMLMAGIVVVADWKASALPPTTGDHDDSRKVPLDLPRADMPDETFEETFGQAPRLFQKELAALATTEPAIYLVQAPTGEGKTKAAIHLAQQLVARMKFGGVLFALPTQATANMLHSDVMHQWANQMSALMWLAHGAAKHNDLYMSQDNAHGTQHQLRMLSPVVLSTVDQVLMSFVRNKHQMIRHLGLAGKVLIIDEVHSYDAHMSRLLDNALRWLSGYGVPVILLSATLPDSRRSELVYAYTGRREQIGPHTIVRATATETVTVDVPPSRAPLTVPVSMVKDSVTPTLQAVQDGADVLVICNSRRKAQRVYRQLQKSGVEVYLLHALYTNADRTSREDQVKALFGTEVTDRKRGRVLVSTQIVEQSADLDFDVLVTDLCPTDRIIQRFGRVYRNRDVTRPVPPHIYIVQAHDNWLYSDWILAQTKDVWSKLTSVTLPTDTEALLNATYEQDRHPELAMAHRNHESSEYAIADDKVLRPRRDTLCGMFPYHDDDVSVRLGDPSVPVVPVINGLLIDGSDKSDEQRHAANTVQVPASWGWKEGLREIESCQYGDEGLYRYCQ